MGWREGIEIGLSLSNAYNRDKLQSAELAQQAMRQTREQGLWSAMDEAAADTQGQIDQARTRTSIPGADVGLATPARDPRVLRQGGYADEQSQAQPEQIGFGQAYEQAIGRLHQKAKIAHAAGDAKALLGVQDELRQLQMDAGSAAIKNQIINANAQELGDITKTISDNKRNNWQMKVDPKTGITTVSNGGESVAMNKDQLGDLIAARWRLKQGDTTAGEAIAKIHKSFAEEGSGQLATIGSIAKINNDAAKNVSDATYKAGMLGAAQTNAQANMIRAQRTGVGGAAGAPAKPLPATALKMQGEALDAVGTAAGIRSQLGVIEKQIAEGNLDFGVVSNLWNEAKNAIGQSDKGSKNFASFKATLEKLRNDSLRLNKGVQTDGDAQRAWAELIKNINDKGVVQQRIKEISEINERAEQLQKLRVDQIRGNYNAPPMDFDNIATPAAPVRPAAPAKGQVYKGHRFLGGDPADRNSWEVAR